MALQKTAAKIPSYRNRLSYHSMLLGGIGFLSGAALVIAHVETRGAIEHALAEEQRASLVQVIPVQHYEGNLLAEQLPITLETGETKTVFIARKDGMVMAAAFEVSEPGYSGDIRVIMGVDKNGEILGVRTLSHTETPGLGDKIELARNDWVLSFNGKSVNNPDDAGWALQKDGGIFDQFTGATITPRAYVKAVKGGLDFFEQHKVQIIEKPMPEPVEVEPEPVPVKPKR
ncbi:electron transport complex subunit RsxG [Candidatus Albibeggiatoa sp. nov. NOAA]|uniref:electron transport complex subunit RsxG n=1 Tax=Candidatus Albibeggiatoa sp. nov. NOAA TaxID=3162724 RepID=UPI0032F59122|nr:electron transport complex subunit RsxG [Thiotrichaceae bacterium]